MLSSDKNVETIAQLIEVLKRYVGQQGEYMKLDIIEKVVRLLTATALFLLFVLILIAIAIFLSFALAYWISDFIGLAPAFLAVAALYVLVIVLFIKLRHAWIEKPLVRFLAGLFLN